MAIYVDALSTYPTYKIAPAARKYGNTWAHLWADDLDELHTFAAQLGLQKDWYQDKTLYTLNIHLGHYDITPAMKKKALASGAQERRVYDWIMERRRQQS